MSSNKSIDLKPIIDEAKSVPVAGAVMSNELGWFHSAASTMKSGAPAAPPVTSLPKTNLGDFLQRATKISSGTMASTDAYGAQIIAIDPWKLFLESTFIAEKVQNYKFIRGSLEVQISVNAPAGAYGLYYLVAKPFAETNFTGSGGVLGFWTPTVKNMPHIEIDLAKCTDGKIVLPWNHWNDYADLGDNATAEGYCKMWKLYLVCYQPIAIATGSSTPEGSFRIWARCTQDHDLVIPYLQMMPNTFDDARAMVDNEVDSFRDSVNSSSIAATGMKPSGIAGAISTGATAVAAAVPFLAPFAGAVAAVSSGVGAVLSWFGFTREMAQQTPTTIVRRNYSNVANMDCDDTSEVAALLRENAISIDPRLTANSPEDEAAFNYLMSKYVLIGTAEWSPTAVPQDEILSIPVTPFISKDSMEGDAVLTAAGYLGFPFSYWRGTMQYLIVVPLSKFHRGVLQVSWSPDAAGAVVDVTNCRYNHILDMSTCAVWEFTVGYVSTKPMLDTTLHVFGEAVASVAGANGLITISVANPLTSPKDTAGTNVWVFARGCADMDFAVPRSAFRPSTDLGLGAVRDFATGFTLQMSGAIGNDVAEVKSFNLVPATTAPTKELCSGERFDSVRGLMQKFSQDLNVQRTLSSANFFAALNHFPTYPATFQYEDISVTPAVTANAQYFTWCGYYGCLFTGIAASTRRKFVNNSPTSIAVGCAPINCEEGVDMSLARTINTVNPIWSIATGEAVEITLPYYYNRRFYPTWQMTFASSVLDGTSFGRVDEFRAFVCSSIGSSANYQGITGYVAYGPDLRFGMFRQIPAITIFEITSNATGWTNNLTP